MHGRNVFLVLMFYIVLHGEGDPLRLMSKFIRTGTGVLLW